MINTCTHRETNSDSYPWIHTHKYAYICTFIYIYIYKLYTYISVSPHKYADICTYICMYNRPLTNIHMCEYSHTDTDRYTDRTGTHTQRHAQIYICIHRKKNMNITKDTYTYTTIYEYGHTRIHTNTVGAHGYIYAHTTTHTYEYTHTKTHMSKQSHTRTCKCR